MVWTGQHQAHEDKREYTCPVEGGGVVLLHERATIRNPTNGLLFVNRVKVPSPLLTPQPQDYLYLRGNVVLKYPHIWFLEF